MHREEVLTFAYACCKANGGAAGVDNQSFEDIGTCGVERWLDELAQAVARIQALALVTRQYCFDEECISAFIPNSHLSNLSNAVFLSLSRTQSPAVYSVLTRWGFHFSNLSADVRFKSGKVSFFSYELMLSAPRLDVGRDAIVVRVTSQDKLLGRSEGAAYRITTSGAWPDNSVGIALTPNSSQELVNVLSIWNFTAFGL
jgi:hypothetical protein